LALVWKATWQRFTGEANFNRIGFERLVEAAEAGDSGAIHAFQETEAYLAMAIGNIASALNPQAVILSGKIIRVPGSIKRIQEQVAQSPFSPEVRPAPLSSDELFLRGAVYLASEKVFSAPPWAAACRRKRARLTSRPASHVSAGALP
jgi:predicted NBD/HSP70 family sugar kinase